MELVKRKEDCCGCRTCEKVCPAEAITIEADVCGFLYPHIEKEKCIDCGLCLKKCAFQSGYETRREYEPSYGYGARHKEEPVYMNSRSGGVFSALSDYILSENGVVYGAGFDEEKGCSYVIHKRAESKEVRDEFRGSKYVQSDLSDVFLQIRQDLKNGRKVLFTGTGCQTGALYKYLGETGADNRLYSVDIVCHGTPSPKIWADFIRMREKELCGKAEKADFRDKKNVGWKGHGETLWLDGKAYPSKVYTRLFHKEFSRPSCYHCIYTNKNRVGDITLADFWGHEKAIPGQWDDDKGISLVLVNNAQGKALWEKAKKDLEYTDCTGYPYRHMNMKHPSEISDNYEEFWEDYKQRGFEYCAKKYANYKGKEKALARTAKKQGADSLETGKASGFWGRLKRFIKKETKT